MEENIMEVPNKTTWQERLSGFTVSHFLISLFGFVAGFICLGLSEIFPLYVAFFLGAVILLLLYVAAGVYMARQHKWSVPERRERFFDFLRPALIAWAWGGLVLITAYLRQTSGLAMLLLMLSAAVASPSLLIVILSAMSGLFDHGLPGFLIGLFLAGGIPPLLFILGSLWGSRKHQKQQTEEGSE